MELKKGPLSFSQLVVGGLQAANRAFGAALALFAIVFAITLLTTMVQAFGVWVFPRYAFLIQIPLGLCLILLGIMTPLALIQILASKIEKTGESAWNCLTSCVLPAVYFVASSFLLAIPALLIMGAAFLSHSSLIVALCYIVLSFLMLPFIFVQHAIALRGETPVSALWYSWKLATHHYVRILLYLFGIGAVIFILLLSCLCVAKAFHAEWLGNPMMLQMHLLALPKLYLLLGSFIFFVVYVFGLLTFQAIITLLFLNLDYCHRQVKTREHDTPLVQAAIGITDPVELLSEVKVKHASIETSVNENTISHLEKVYSAQEHLSQAVQQQEEDRMPTLLFDEEMIKKLAETERDLKEKQEKEKNAGEDPENPPSIKISNNSL